MTARKRTPILEVVVVAASALFVFWQVHPSLILARTTPAGGDMGAHVWAFGFLRDVLLPAGRLSGWAPDWYAGFPAFQFYMVVPFLAMVVLNTGFAGWAIPPVLALTGAIAGQTGVDDPGDRAWRAGAGATIGAVGGLACLAIPGAGAESEFAGIVVGASMAIWSLRRAARAQGRFAWAPGVAAVVVVALGIALPYGPAFKVVAVSGIVAMPVAGYAFGRLAGIPRPTPTLFAVAVVAFLFDKNFTIYGGNAASTMAGEFAFSISLALALLYLGVLVDGLRTGRRRGTAAVLLALVGLCHLIPAFFAIGATAVLYVVHVVAELDRDRRGRVVARAAGAGAVVVLVAGVLAAVALGVGAAPAATVALALGLCGLLIVTTRSGPAPAVGVGVAVAVADGPSAEGAVSGRRVGARSRWLAQVGVVAGLLGAWWVLPFAGRSTYLNDMGWEKIAVHRSGTAILDWFTDAVWPELVPSDFRLWAALGLVGAVLAVATRHRVTVAMVAMAIGLALAFVYVPQGRLWNARLLPFWYLVVYLLAAYALAEITRALAHVAGDGHGRPLRGLVTAAPPVFLAVLVVFLGMQLRNLPTGDERADGSYSFLGVSTQGRNFVTDWARWNFSGYERKGAYPEYRAIVDTMADVGAERGCGMSMWEYRKELNDYGTPMALMLLPHWTDGCIGSMEGLYFEASSTTPFHFLVQSELSAAPSRAQRDLPYRDADLRAGVDHLQLLGVRYYMAQSAEMVEAADAEADLERVATSGPWVVYEVAGAEKVQALTNQPAVTTASEHQDAWLCADLDPAGRCQGAALDWFQESARWDVALAADGPAEWQRIDPGQTPTTVPVAPTTVSDIATGRDGISFRVDVVGTPVLVKESYFPNWQVSGADGPYRVAPNLMLVVPTEHEVTMRFGRTSLDHFALALTVLGLVALALLVRRGRLAVPELAPLADPLDLDAVVVRDPEHDEPEDGEPEDGEPEHDDPRHDEPGHHGRSDGDGDAARDDDSPDGVADPGPGLESDVEPRG